MSNAFQPTCSVIICTRNRPAELDRCLDAVSRLGYPRFHVLVVDNAPSDDATQKTAARWGANYLLESVAGLSRARNRGARACTNEIVAFLDDDAVPEPGWLAGLAAEFEDPLVMAVTGRVLPLHPDGTQKVPEFVSVLDLGSEPRRLDRQNPQWFEIANFGGIGDGMNMAFRRSAFAAWPGFDERIGRGMPLPGSEEHHAFSSLIERGFRVVYTPQAVVGHPYSLTMQDHRARYLRDYSAAVGYMVFLFFEGGHRRKVARYIVEAMLGTRRSWRGQHTPSVERSVSRLRLLCSAFSGVLRCLRSR